MSEAYHPILLSLVSALNCEYVFTQLQVTVKILIISLVVRFPKNGAKTLLLDSARQGQSHVNYVKFLSFYFKQQLLKYLVGYIHSSVG